MATQPTTLSSEVFKSELTCDTIILKNTGDHNLLTISYFDNITENLKLVNRMLAHAKKNNMQFVCVKFDEDYEIPDNMQCFTKVNGTSTLVACHVNEFEKFYTENMKNLVASNMIAKKPANDGWTEVTSKRYRRKKYKNIQKQISDIGLVNKKWESL